MTPLQVIMLAHETRKSQTAFLSAMRGEEGSLMDRYKTMTELEEKLDAAIKPYVDYHRSIQEGDHDS